MFRERTAFFDKEMDEFGVSNRTRREIYTAPNWSQQFAVIFGRVDRDEDRARFDPEFLRQRSS